MPPSAGACQTMPAELKPDWGRAGARSSIMTATTGLAASDGETSDPVRASTTSAGVGCGVGEGVASGVGSGVASAVTVASVVGPGALGPGLEPAPDDDPGCRDTSPAMARAVTTPRARMTLGRVIDDRVDPGAPDGPAPPARCSTVPPHARLGLG